MICAAGKLNRDQFYAWLNPEGMTLDEKYDRARLLGQCAEVTEEVYQELLEVLPPMHWTSREFAMCEATTQDLRLGFFRSKGRRFAAYVSDDDPSRSMKATRELLP